jgi:protein TonB
MMMRHQTLAPWIELRRKRTSLMAKRRNRFLLVAVVLSLGVHLAAALLVVLLPRILPKQTQPQEQGTVELLMVEKKGAEAGQAGQPRDNGPPPERPQKADTPVIEQQKAEPQKVEPSTPPSSGPPALPRAEKGDEPAAQPTERAPPKPTEAPPDPKQAEAQPAPKRAEVQPAPPRSQEALVMDLDGTDSESNAIVLGGRVVPAMKDDRFRNRPPIYPPETANRYGTVVVVIHVSENGAATSADVQQSSGFDELDQAAITAVLKWHFHPAIRDGRSVPFDMPFRFVFEPY